MSKILDAKIPSGPLTEKWDRHAMDTPLVAPANRRKYSVIVVGTGLAGGGAAATLGELGYNVLNFCIQDTPRRAHSVAAQGGINAAKNYQYDSDSVYRLFYDTIKGGDYRSREANVYRLAQLSANIIDQSVAQGVPFAREYGGTLANRSFGGVQVSRTFYARGVTGQQLLLGVYAALSRQVGAGAVKMFPRHEMLDLVVVDGRARGIICRDLVTGELKRYVADAVVLATGGYSPVYYLSTNAVNSNATAAWRAYRRGAFFANPCYTQIHPTAVPQMGDYQSKLTLMSESLRNDGRVWVPKKPGDKRRPNEIPEAERDYYLERRYPAFGNLVPRDIAARAAKVECDAGKSAYMSSSSVYLDFADAIERLGRDVVADRYGNLFDMYEEITADDPYHTPMMIYPAPHYTMGGLWVDYDLESTIPGLFVAGEANFSDHGANRLGASALMQGCADGYFVVPRVVAGYLARGGLDKVATDHGAFAAAENDVRNRYDALLKVNGSRTVRDFHWELGRIMWDEVGMARTRAGLEGAIERISALRGAYWQDVKVPGESADFNKQLEQAGRVADFLELGELMARDALDREESCGGHFREEHKTEEGEAKRDDENYMYVAAWEFKGDGAAPAQHKEALEYENIEVKTRSYK
ncbi:fumarate reductase/succinate dehydrogenase flavoprotein subunit [bacterium]|nr:fumarate reductase/succinate dehydrogenase flavoprotein subunit [bacterium]MBU1073767.1 fumarate reductase/succinate dehydrogenase flavoprotein subunit [bacterium]MBU1676939.1 fumarate reductase/succinate dehydrogenase flavoprotein subunit [bacterium]